MLASILALYSDSVITRNLMSPLILLAAAFEGIAEIIPAWQGQLTADEFFQDVNQKTTAKFQCTRSTSRLLKRQTERLRFAKCACILIGFISGRATALFGEFLR